MNPDLRPDEHEVFQSLIDRELVEDLAADEKRTLEAHLASCTVCQQYAASNQRVLEGLGDLSFEASPFLTAKTNAVLEQRAAELQKRSRRWSLFAAALALTLVGSFLDIRLGHLLAPLLGVPAGDVTRRLLAYWIAPAFVVLLLFPLSPLLSANNHALPEVES